MTAVRYTIHPNAALAFSFLWVDETLPRTPFLDNFRVAENSDSIRPAPSVLSLSRPALGGPGKREAVRDRELLRLRFDELPGLLRSCE